QLAKPENKRDRTETSFQSETHFSSDTDFEDIEGKNQKQGKGKVRSFYWDTEKLVVL
uniref:Uncharacterized protein n=1 Tax=Meleagris gallopavo TaxID=9103 RepID=A0A803YMF1_MELGA